jgi:hypothetical protein
VGQDLVRLSQWMIVALLRSYSLHMVCHRIVFWLDHCSYNIVPCLDDRFLINNLPLLVQRIALGTTQTQSYIQSITSTAWWASYSKLHYSGPTSVLHSSYLCSKSTFLWFGIIFRRNKSWMGRLIICVYAVPTVPLEWWPNDVRNWLLRKEYNFKVKPGDAQRQPRFISPYHERLDWQMWIASQSGGIDRSPWLMSFLLKLLLV